MKALLIRLSHGDTQTLGEFRLYDGLMCVFSCKTLELPDKNNQRNISRINEGFYSVEKRYSAKYENHYIVKDVQGRDLILIHPGNFYTDTRGCILVGGYFKDLNQDGLKDIAESKAKMRELLAWGLESFTLEIIDL